MPDNSEDHKVDIIDFFEIDSVTGTVCTDLSVISSRMNKSLRSRPQGGSKEVDPKTDAMTRSLNHEIQSAILRRKDTFKKTESFTMNTDLMDNISYFCPQSYCFKSEDVTAYRIAIKCEVFAVSKLYLAVYSKEGIDIYRIQDNFCVKKRRNIKSHLLIFLYRVGAITHKVLKTLLSVVIHLYSEKIMKLESHLEGLCCFIDLENVVDMKFVGETIECRYRNSDLVIYDDKFNIMHNGSWLESIEKGDDEEIAKYNAEHYDLVVRKKNIYLEYHQNSFREVLEMHNICDSAALDNVLFVLTLDSVNVLVFG